MSERLDEASVTTDRPNGLRPRRVLVLGGTGTIGRATVRALVARGHEVVCLVRRSADTRDPSGPVERARLPSGAAIRFVDVTDPSSLVGDGFRGEPFDVLVSCLASRTGLPDDAWAIDYEVHVGALNASKVAGVTHVVLLSAICVQKPILAFQHAKLAFEKVLIASGLDYTIVRPTAFFKSLSGQIDRVKRGKPFLVFGDGLLTACKPIGDDDLGTYLADCLDAEDRRNRVLPIGGPGEAITPKAQGERLFALLGREPRFKHVPVGLLDMIIAILAALGRVVPALAAKAELARIGRYYATESMLVLDPATGQYDARATPSTGSETLFDYYARLVRGEAVAERGDHAVF
jgi:divinyl chlorophyllide a 8-vinyl-reductase